MVIQEKVYKILTETITNLTTQLLLMLIMIHTFRVIFHVKGQVGFT